MNRSSVTPKTDPWRVPVMVTQIPEGGLYREIEADRAERDAMAELAGVREVSVARASLQIAAKPGGRFHVGGHVRARIGQTCVVTLDPVENEIDEPIDLTFAPPEQIPALADLVEEASASGEEVPDPLEPIINGMIDLGRLATDALLLGIDPYPRRPDAVFDPPVIADDPEDRPFAALKALQTPSKPSGPKKPTKRQEGPKSS